MKRIFFWIVALSIIVIGAVALFWERTIPPQPLVQAGPVTPPKKIAVPAVAYPLPDTGRGGSSPPGLDSSDDAILAALIKVQRALSEVMLSERLVRNVVVTIDNLPREVVSARMRPVKPVPGTFHTSQEGAALRISPANESRYRDYVRIFEETSPEQLVALYVEFYPLFQQAYQELGYPNQYFNDRVIAVIDHLLDAPEPEGSINLVQPKVLYEFADSQFQYASAGHKVMMRLGSENARRVKAHLKKIRDRIVAKSEKVQSPS